MWNSFFNYFFFSELPDSSLLHVIKNVFFFTIVKLLIFRAYENWRATILHRKSRKLPIPDLYYII